MGLRALVFCALLGVVGTAADSSGAAIWPPANLEAFTAACRTHPGLQSMAAEQGDLPMDQLCTCFAGKIAGVSQADADMLTKDLLDTTTPEERKAYQGYDTLSALASTSLDQCMTTSSTAAVAPAPAPAATVAAAPEPAAPAPAEPQDDVAAVPATPPVEAANAITAVPQTQSASIAPTPAGAPHRLSTEATGFLNACVASKPFGGYLTSMQPGDEALQGTICSCLTGALVEKVAATDMPLLARDFDEKREPSETPSESYKAAAQAAQDGLRTCMTDSGLKPNF